MRQRSGVIEFWNAAFTYKSTISTSDEDQDCRLKYAKKAGPFLTPLFI